MKLKNATQLAIIGIILELIPQLMWLLASSGILKQWNQETNGLYWYFQYLGLLNLLGTTLLLPFFIILFKSQK